MENLPKFLVRFAIFYIALYFLYTYGKVIFDNELVFNDLYIVILEYCLCLFVSVQGNYHCKYARYTAWGISLSDTTTRLDGVYDFIPVGYAAEIPATILALGLCTSVFLSVRHFIISQKLKRKKKKLLEKYGTGFGK